MPNNNPRGCAFAFRRTLKIYPQLEATPDLTRGEQRLAAEVALAELRGQHVPTRAHERAHRSLAVLARG